MTIPLFKSIKINIMLCFAFQYSNSLPSHLGNDDLCLSLQEYQLLFPHIGPLKQQFYCKHGMNVWVNMCVCVCVCENMLAWKYVLFVSSSTFKTTLMQKIPLCILTIWTIRNYWFYFQKTRFFNNINSLLKRILLMLTSTGKSFVYVLFKMCKERGRGKKCHMLLVEILTQVFFP